VEVLNVSSQKLKAGHHMEVEIRLPNSGLAHRILAELEALSGVEVESLTPAEDA